MRLIDADKLIAEHCADCKENVREMCRIDPICASAMWVVEAPTVDAVEIPCRIGDTVWAIRTYRDTKKPLRGVVSDMVFNSDMELLIVVRSVARGKWGEKVFATYEEAQAAIEERRETKWTK